jgi:hypothetical protein
MDTAPDPSRANVLVATRVRIEAQARRDGYVEPAAWQAVAARLIAFGCSHTDLADLQAELAHSAAAYHWVFADEPPPVDRRRAMELLVEKARSHSRRVPVITQGFLSALLRLAGQWGLAHDVVAQEIAARSVAEHWSVDWELACDMEGLLGAEQAAQRQRTARERAVAQFEHRGRKGWLSTRDLNTLYATIRECGLHEAEAGAVWDELHSSADARGRAWAGRWSGSEPKEQRLNVLVEKLATQAKAKPRIARGFRHALLAEATAAGVDQGTLLNVIAARRICQRWPATFDRGWHLEAVDNLRCEPLRLWWRWMLGRIDDADVVGRWRMPAQSALRVAPPTLALMVLLNTLHPSAASPPLASPAPAAVVAPFAPLTTAAPQPGSAPRPVVVQPLTLVVAHTDGVGARLRTAPVTGPVARLLGEGTAVVEIGSELDIDGAGWRQVRAPDGTSGWMAADLLQGDDAGPGGTR